MAPLKRGLHLGPLRPLYQDRSDELAERLDELLAKERWESKSDIYEEQPPKLHGGLFMQISLAC